MQSWTSLFVALSAAWWLFQAFRLARAIAGLPRVADMPREGRPAWHRLSLVVPARNESTHLEEAVRTRLAEGYPELEVVTIAVLAALELGWLVGFTQPEPASWLALATFVVAASTQVAVGRWLSMPRWPAVLPGASIIPLGWVLIRSAVLAWRRGGVVWRDTFYPTAVVRAGIRLGRHQPKMGKIRSS